MANVFSNGHFTSFNMVISSSVHLLPFSILPFSPVTSTLALPFVKLQINASHQAISFLAKRLYSSGIVTLLHNIICSLGPHASFWKVVLRRNTRNYPCGYQRIREWNSSGRWALLARNILFIECRFQSETFPHWFSFSGTLCIQWSDEGKKYMYVNTWNTMDCVTMHTDGMDCIFLFHCCWKCIAVGTSNEIFFKSLSIMSTSPCIVWYLDLK